MAKLSLRPSFILDSIKVVFKKSPKALIFGDVASLSKQEKELISKIEGGVSNGSNIKGGMFNKVDVVHKGSGHAYLVSNNDDPKKSYLVLGHDFRVTPGPDLYAYLVTGSDPKEELGEHLDLGELKGTKSAQVYEINKPIDTLSSFKSAAIYCKQFSVLFSSAELK